MKKKIFYGYYIVGAGIVIQGICYGAMFTYGIFFKEFQAEFGWSRAAISGASSLAFLLMGPIGIFAGRLNDKIGPRLLVTGSSILFGLGYVLLSYISYAWQLYVLYGLLVCIGFGSHDVFTLSTVARWFVKKRGMMTGIVKAGTGFGQLLLPLSATFLITAYGWRKTYLILGLLFIIILISVAQVLRRDPQEIGLLPDNDKHDVQGVQDRLIGREGMTLRTAGGTRQFWAMCIAEFSSFFCLITIIVHIVPHAIDIGIPQTIAAGILSTIGGVSMVSRIILGTANDRIGGKRSLSICFVILLGSLLWLQIANNPWMLLFFAIVYGFAHGGFFTVVSPTVAELFGTRSHGVLFGIVLFCGTTGGAIGPILAGYHFDTAETYRTIFFVLAGVALVGLLTIMSLRPLPKQINIQATSAH